MADSPQTISADALCSLTGLTDRRHRQLAKEGYFPPPIESQYILAPTIQGLFRYYRESYQRSSRALLELKSGKLERENKKLDLEIARTERKLVPVADVDNLLLHVATLQKVILFQKLEREMPVRTDGKSTVEKQLIGRGIADELCEIFAHESERWTAQIEESDPAGARR